MFSNLIIKNNLDVSTITNKALSLNFVHQGKDLLGFKGFFAISHEIDISNPISIDSFKFIIIGLSCLFSRILMFLDQIALRSD